MNYAYFKRSVFFFYVLTASVLWGQPTRFSRFIMGDNVLKTIVRDYNFPASISYIETSTEHMFIYNDGNLALKKVSINSTYSVNDFIVDGDRVYFCGDAGGIGIYGTFNIVNFFNINQVYEVNLTPMYSQQNTVTSLNKMTFYMLNGLRYLVAIGQSTTGQQCVVELKYGPSGWTCRVGELGSMLNEQLLDITLTENYVVTAGTIYSSASLLCARVYDKNDIFSTSTPVQDNYSDIFNFSSSTLNPTFPYLIDINFAPNQVVLSMVENDFFLLSAYWQSPSGQYLTYPKGLYVGAFEINTTMPDADVHDLTGAIIPQPYLLGGWRLRGMTSLPFINASIPFYILQEAEYNSILPTESTVYKLTYNDLMSSSLAFQFKLSLNTKFLSVNGRSSISQYVMNGYSVNDNQSLIYFERFTPSGGNCMENVTLNLWNVDVTTKRNTHAFTVNSHQISMKALTGGKPTSITGSIMCQGKDVEPQIDEQR